MECSEGGGEDRVRWRKKKRGWGEGGGRGGGGKRVRCMWTSKRVERVSVGVSASPQTHLSLHV